jgi:hypothetical protein
MPNLPPVGVLAVVVERAEPTTVVVVVERVEPTTVVVVVERAEPTMVVVVERAEPTIMVVVVKEPKAAVPSCITHTPGWRGSPKKVGGKGRDGVGPPMGMNKLVTSPM